MPKCGSQIILCELPVRFDTYTGCSHNCTYCFVQKKIDISKIEPFESLKALKNFVEGKRSSETSWCDWDIPLHWGGVSDPFQPIEKIYRRSFDCLKYLAETQYPFVISTKGRLIVETEYLKLLSKCNAVVQVSMVSSLYDKLEPGAPTFEERMEMLPLLAKNTRRLIVRISPYSVGLADNIAAQIPRYKSAGVFGIEIEAMKRSRNYLGFVKIGADWCYPIEPLRRDFEVIKTTAKENGLAFFVGENRLRLMGDDTCCCGISGLQGFEPNRANLNRVILGEQIQYSKRMQERGTARVFNNGFAQKQSLAIQIQEMSYKDCMDIAAKTKSFLKVMGVDLDCQDTGFDKVNTIKNG